MQMHTKYIYLHYVNYLTFFISYNSFVNCIRFPTVAVLLEKDSLMHYAQTKNN